MTDIPANGVPPGALARAPLAGEGRRSLPVGSIGTSASGWWGVWLLVISDSFLFAYEFFSYFWYSVQPQANWVPGGPPGFLYSGPQTGVVALGCVTSWFALRSINRNERALTLIALGLTFVFASAFISLQFLGWWNKPFGFSSSTYSSIYFLITGTHLAHFVAGWFMVLAVLLWTALGYFDDVRHVPIAVVAVYWYFLAAAWFGVWFVTNITPYFY